MASKAKSKNKAPPLADTPHPGQATRTQGRKQIDDARARARASVDRDDFMEEDAVPTRDSDYGSDEDAYEERQSEDEEDEELSDEMPSPRNIRPANNPPQKAPGVIQRSLSKITKAVGAARDIVDPGTRFAPPGPAEQNTTGRGASLMHQDEEAAAAKKSKKEHERELNRMRQQRKRDRDREVSDRQALQHHAQCNRQLSYEEDVAQNYDTRKDQHGQSQIGADSQQSVRRQQDHSRDDNEQYSASQHVGRSLNSSRDNSQQYATSQDVDRPSNYGRDNTQRYAKLPDSLVNDENFYDIDNDQAQRGFRNDDLPRSGDSVSPISRQFSQPMAHRQAVNESGRQDSISGSDTPKQGHNRVELETPRHQGQTAKRRPDHTSVTSSAPRRQRTGGNISSGEADDEDEPASEPDYVNDNNSTTKIAVLQRSCRVFLFINPCPTAEEISTFVHSMLDTINDVGETEVCDIDSPEFMSGFTHVRNSKSSYKSKTLGKMQDHFKKALRIKPDLPDCSDDELRQFWTNHYSPDAFLQCFTFLQGYVDPGQSKPLAQYVMKSQYVQLLTATRNVHVADYDHNSKNVIQTFYDQLRFTVEYAGLSFGEFFMLSGAHRNQKKQNLGKDLTIRDQNYKSIGPPPPPASANEQIKWPSFMGPNVKARGHDQRQTSERYSPNARRDINPPSGSYNDMPIEHRGQDGLAADFSPSIGRRQGSSRHADGFNNCATSIPRPTGTYYESGTSRRISSQHQVDSGRGTSTLEQGVGGSGRGTSSLGQGTVNLERRTSNLGQGPAHAGRATATSRQTNTDTGRATATSRQTTTDTGRATATSRQTTTDTRRITATPTSQRPMARPQSRHDGGSQSSTGTDRDRRNDGTIRRGGYRGQVDGAYDSTDEDVQAALRYEADYLPSPSVAWLKRGY